MFKYHIGKTAEEPNMRRIIMLFVGRNRDKKKHCRLVFTPAHFSICSFYPIHPMLILAMENEEPGTKRLH